ncbi:MAG: G3E family GTPase [Gammaproteobacteria bacterium]
MIAPEPSIVNPLAVTVIGGYLGVGKTTLVNRLLRDANGLRLAVLVNEFGELPIDGDLIEAEDGNVISIAGGCVCCSYGNDLLMALIDLAKLRPRPDHVLLEASGVALPGAIAASIGLLQDYVTDAVIVLADAETVRERASDRYMGDTVERQLNDADLIVLNKIDLVAAHTGEATLAWLTERFPQARVAATSQANLPPDLVLHSAVGRERLDRASAPHQLDHFETFSIALQNPVDAEQLARRLADSQLGLLRAKGFVTTHAGTLMAIQVVGRRWSVFPAAASTPSGLVCIGLKAQINHQALRDIASYQS